MSISSATRQIIISVIVIFFIMLGGSAFFFWGDLVGFLGFGMGLFLGAALSCVKVVMMELSIARSLQASEGLAGGVVGGAGFVLRYVLTGAVLLAAIFIEPINHWGAVAGIIALQPAAYSARFFVKELKDDLPPPEL